MTLKELANTALRGTARAELPKLQGTALGNALARLEATNTEAALLSCLALADLHAHAGVALLAAEAPPPATLPPAANPLPAKLWPLLRQLSETAAAPAVLADLQVKNWTLSAAQALVLNEKNASFAAQLWPLLDERGQAVLDAHPLHNAWQKADAQAQWQAQLDALREARQANAAAGAAQTFALWQEVKADERRDLLDLLESGLLTEDLPLLQSAEKDRSAEVQRRARLLQGHLPGPLQDELLALLPQVVKNQGKSWKMMPFDLPEALGKVKAGEFRDTEYHRLLGALPFDLILQTLGIDKAALIAAAEKQHWYLRHFVAELIEKQKQKRCAHAEKTSTVDMTAQHAARWLRGIQEKGHRDQAAFERFARLLDPATDIPAPEPLPFVLPPAPTMPQAKRMQWEENMRAQHEYRQAEAEAAWRDLSEVLRLRREWAQALAEG